MEFEEETWLENNVSLLKTFNYFFLVIYILFKKMQSEIAAFAQK